jgi:hypothetical protein
LEREASPPPEEAPRMLINSVSGEVIVRSFDIRCRRRLKSSENY